MCEREKKCEKERESMRESECVCVCGLVKESDPDCVSAREEVRERAKHRERDSDRGIGLRTGSIRETKGDLM